MNCGPVASWFLNIISINTTNVSATATAVVAFAGTVKNGTLLPYIIPTSTFNADNGHNTPSNPVNLGTGAPPAQGDGTFTTFNNASNGGNGNSDNSDNDVKDLVGTGNTGPLSIGDQIWSMNGTRGQSVYNAISSDYTLPHNFVLAVVNQICNGCDTTIVGFVGFTLTSIGGHGVNSYLTGYFTGNVEVAGGPSGPYYGTYIPPVLVQ